MRIAFFCYPSAENNWSSSSAESGIGGSEEAVMRMAALLAARGHKVLVCNAPSRPTVEEDGVHYCGYDALSGPVDIGIVWRRAGLLARLRRVRAGRLYLWLHDLVDFASFADRLAWFRRVMLLSRFHRNHYPALGAEKAMITSNGITPEDFARPEPRDPRLMVYGSSYNRGLRTLLENWRRIRSAVPEARLHVFYGWQTIARMNPARFARLQPYFESLMRQDGITHLGRIGQCEVAREYLRAGIWAYPCSFPETSCISAMKAQAGGAVPAVIPTGALDETVRYGFRTMRSYTDYAGLPIPRRVIEEWLEGLIGLLRAPERQARIRAAMMPECRARFAWPKVADCWEEEFAAP